jgi:hypothetical protein
MCEWSEAEKGYIGELGALTSTFPNQWPNPTFWTGNVWVTAAASVASGTKTLNPETPLGDYDTGTPSVTLSVTLP